MPPELLALLEKYNSRGYADTLSTLVGQRPTYNLQPVDVVRDGGKVMAKVTGTNPDSATINLFPAMRKKFGEKTPTGRPGYTALDPSQQFGDYVLAHEFGHVASRSNSPLGDRMAELELEGGGNEQVADDFQQATQFLRSHSTDTTRVPPRVKRMMDIVLQHHPYENHPITKARAAQAPSTTRRP
jgi:hypothetical protein